MLFSCEEIRPQFVFDGAVVVIGDFNEVTNISDRRNCDNLSSSARQFIRFINSSKLMDFPLHGRKFT